MRYETRLALGAMLVLAGLRAEAQQEPPAVHPLGAVTATATGSLGNVSAVRQLSNGRVLVNDGGSRRLLMFDASLANPIVVADSTTGVSNTYGARAGVLIASHGDSTFLVDVTSPSMLLIDPSGKIAGIKSVPRPQDAASLTAISAFDAMGRLVYRSRATAMMLGAPPAGGGPAIPVQPDSVPIVRVDLLTRKLDTAGFIKVPNNGMSVTQTAGGGVMMASLINPLPMLDEWAVLSDGSIAFVRGRDYHIDWINPDGSRSSSPRMPFDWQRLTDENKIAVIDSARTAIMTTQATATKVAANDVQGNQIAEAKATALIGGGDPVPAGATRVMVFSTGGGADAGGGPPALGTAGVPPALVMPQVTFVDPAKLPDYRPPFTAGALRADADGNLWIRTATKSMADGFIYDIVNRKGEITDRVQVPSNSTVLGFGPGGVVYIGGRDAAGFRLMRARVK